MQRHCGEYETGRKSDDESLAPDPTFTRFQLFDAPSRACHVQTGPHPAGWLGWKGSSATVHAGAVPIDPIFSHNVAGRAPVLSPDLPSLARDLRVKVDATSILQDAWLGFQLSARTLFSEVRQLRTGESVSFAASDTTSAMGSHELDGPLEPISASSMFANAHPTEGAILELSGGVDSRLVLALLLDAGLKPQQAFTLGSPESNDVIAASTICQRFGIKHLVMDPAELPLPTFDQIAKIVTASVFRANSAAVGWFPCLFERLASVRDAQITGTGGECAEGFYFSPADCLVRTARMRRMWIQLRLFDGDAAGRAAPFEPHIATRSLALTMAEAEQSLSGTLRWRDHLWWLYREDRMRAWALPILLASSQSYTVVAPFLSPAYLQRAQALRDRERAARRWQIECIASAYPQLLDTPFATDPRGSFRPAHLAARLASRICRRAKPAPMRAPVTIQVILKDERFRVLLAVYGEELGLRSSYQTPEALAATDSQLVGAITTALLACEARDSSR